MTISSVQVYQRLFEALTTQTIVYAYGEIKVTSTTVREITAAVRHADVWKGCPR